MNTCPGHLAKLAFRDPFLQREKMFVIYAPGLIEHLSPAVPACRLHSQHSQTGEWKSCILVGLSVGKEKVRLATRLCFRLMHEIPALAQSFFLKYRFQMQFKRTA